MVKESAVANFLISVFAKTEVKNYALRLVGVRGGWVPAGVLFNQADELYWYSALTKEVCGYMPVVIPDINGWRMVTMWSYYENAHLDLQLIYVPLGFAERVVQWQLRFKKQLPSGSFEKLFDPNKEDPTVFWSHCSGRKGWWVVRLP